MTQSNPLISIIVPVYKVEKYLPACIDSILAQTYKNFELILVDDGSPDNCGEICDKYAQTDNRIKVIHQKNQGVVVARNNALKIVVGKYLTFVDSDDFLVETFLSETIQKAHETNADIVWTDFYENTDFVENKKQINSLSNNINIDNLYQILTLFIENKIKGYLWNKLIRHEYYQKCNIQTDENCTMMEDKYIMLQLLSNYPQMAYIQKPLYHYTIRFNSASNSEQSNLIKSIPNIQHMYTFLKENNLWEMYHIAFCKFLMIVKFTILTKFGLNKARKFMSYAHRNITTYPLSPQIAWFYWICFNFPFIGNLLYNIHKNFKNK